jgi:hypothetical protein
MGCGACDAPWVELPVFEVWTDDARWGVKVKVCHVCGDHRFNLVRIGGVVGGRAGIASAWALEQVGLIVIATVQKYMRQRLLRSAMRPEGPRLS